MTLNKSSPELPPGCVLRPACATDAGAIRELMSAELLDPTQLHWSQFWVIECNERQVACGQLRRYPGAEEQVRLVVATRLRTRGLGTCLAKHLIQQATKPLYLACGTRLVPFYTR